MSTRDLAVVVGVALASSAAQAVFVTGPVIGVVAAHLVDVLEPVSPAEVARCAADPAGFEPRGAGWTARAYDAGGASAHPDAPPMDGALARRATSRGLPVARMTPFGSSAGLVAVPTGLPGDCAIVGVRWDRADGGREWLAGLQVLATAVAVAVATALALVGLVRPLARDREALERASRAFGTDGWRRPALATRLSPLAAVLDEAHARLVRERAAQEAGRTALERHLAEVAHDLRTPLASLQLRLESMTGRADPEALEAAVADVISLGMLTGNLHAAAQLREPPTRPPPTTDLREVVDRVRVRFSILGSRRGIAVDGAVPDQPVLVAIEPVHAEQLVANLVHNAVAHHPGPGNVAVVLDHRVSGAGVEGFVLHVRDDGPGLSDDARAGRSTGLGLRIARAMCERAGLRLQFGEPEIGAHVRVEG